MNSQNLFNLLLMVWIFITLWKVFFPSKDLAPPPVHSKMLDKNFEQAAAYRAIQGAWIALNDIRYKDTCTRNFPDITHEQCTRFQCDYEDKITRMIIADLIKGTPLEVKYDNHTGEELTVKP